MTATENELLPCPFCGSEADVVRYGLHETIFCLNDICQCQIEGFDGVDARRQWNTRHAAMEEYKSISEGEAKAVAIAFGRYCREKVNNQEWNCSTEVLYNGWFLTFINR